MTNIARTLNLDDAPEILWSDEALDEVASTARLLVVHAAEREGRPVHPNAKRPYLELSPGERLALRKSVRETLRALVLLGHVEAT